MFRRRERTPPLTFSMADLVAWRSAANELAVQVRHLSRRLEAMNSQWATMGRARQAAGRLDSMQHEAAVLERQCLRLIAFRASDSAGRSPYIVDAETRWLLDRTLEGVRGLMGNIRTRINAAERAADPFGMGLATRGPQPSARSVSSPAEASIAEAKIPGIGPKMVALLAACGYRTAADFIGGGVETRSNGYGHEDVAYLVEPDGQQYVIKGLGPQRVRALLDWRRQVVGGSPTQWPSGWASVPSACHCERGTGGSKGEQRGTRHRS